MPFHFRLVLQKNMTLVILFCSFLFFYCGNILQTTVLSSLYHAFLKCTLNLIAKWSNKYIRDLPAGFALYKKSQMYFQLSVGNSEIGWIFVGVWNDPNRFTLFWGCFVSPLPLTVWVYLLYLLWPTKDRQANRKNAWMLVLTLLCFTC